MALQPESGQELRLRPYRSADLRAIFTLDEICFEPLYRFSMAMMRRCAETRGALTVVAERGTAIAGFCIAHVERSSAGARYGYIITLDVAPSERRRGLARSMMQHIETQAGNAECIAMLLHVAVANENAIRFYERSGYVRSQIVRAFYGSGLDAFLYHKPISIPSN